MLDAIDRDPRAAFAEAGLRGQRAGRGGASRGSELRVTRRLHLLLAPHGLAYLVARIHDQYGDGAHRIVTAAGRTS